MTVQSLTPGLLLGTTLAAGLLLIVTPWLWPRQKDARSSRLSGLGILLRERLAQAGVAGVGPGGFLIISLLLGVLGGAVAQALVGVPVASLVAAVVASLLPWLVISSRARVRMRQRRKLWPDVVDHLVSAVRSGTSLPEALASLAESAPAALREPFQEFAADFASRGDWNGGLDRIKEALADATADRIVETLRMARQVGGTELGSVLRSLSAYLREEVSLRSELEARQSWVMNAARLGVAAPWVVLVLVGTRPEAAAAYSTVAGGVLILVTALVSVLAYRVMLIIGRLAEERRWFA